MNEYVVIREDHRGGQRIGTYTNVSNARRAARRILAREGGRLSIEGRARPSGWLFMTEAVELPATVQERCRMCAIPGSPPHRASPRCESGRRPHCTCDICF